VNPPQAAVHLSQTLERLGGSRILPIGKGGEAVGTTEAAFEEFIRALSIVIGVGTETHAFKANSSLDEDTSLSRPLGFVGRHALFDDNAKGSEHCTVYHLELSRKDGRHWTYDEGDYLSNLPVTANVEAIEVYYKLHLEYDTVIDYQFYLFTLIH
jgi:hypothetical protein